MPLISQRSYEPRNPDINDDRDLARFLRDIRRDMGNSGISDAYTFEDKSLSEVLDVVDSGKVRFTLDQGTNVVEIDFSDARQRLADYVVKKLGGCMTCNHMKSFKPCQDETCRYCGVCETEDDCPSEPLGVLGNPSPMVSRYNHDEVCESRLTSFESLKIILERVQLYPDVARTN